LELFCFLLAYRNWHGQENLIGAALLKLLHQKIAYPASDPQSFIKRWSLLTNIIPPHAGGMASTTRAMMRLPASSIGFSTATRRSFATSSSVSRNLLTRAQASSRVTVDKSKLQRAFRRTYADVAPVKKPKRFRLLKFIWRATYLSAIAGAGYLAYGVWELRHPEDQFEPDPTKKNLVILGTLILIQPHVYLANCLFCRYWMGSCISPEET
jgi:hypothetical protein